MVSALLTVVTAQLLSLFLLIGWGSLVRRAFGTSAARAEQRLDDFWLGFALLLAFLQLWHFLRPINETAFLLFVLTGLAGWVPTRVPAGLRAPLRAALPRLLWGAALVIPVATLVAYRSLGFLCHYDTQLYHYPAVQWASSYPIVPGLANLHGRFGFNSAFPLFAALIDRGPLEARVYHVANGAVLLPALLQVAFACVRLMLARPPLTAAALFTAFMLGPLSSQLPYLVGLSNDVPAFVLGFVAARLLLELVASSGCTERPRAFLWFALVLVSSAGVAVKPSFALLAVPMVASAPVALWLQKERSLPGAPMRLVGLAAAAAGVLLLPWLLRGYLLSGYPVYPSTFGGMDFPWRVPRSLVLSEALCIRGHAREPGAFWMDALSGWQWLTPWWTRAAPSLALPLTISAVALAALLLRCVVQRSSGLARGGLCALAPFAVALAAWFLAAPDPRFAGVAPWALSVAACALLLAPRAPRAAVSLNGWHLRVAGIALLLLSARAEEVLGAPSAAAFEPFAPMRVAAAHARMTDSGDLVFVPNAGFFCTEASLPCTPYFRRNLRYITPGNAGGGFVLDPPPIFADVRQRGNYPHGLSASTDLGVCVVDRGGCYSYRRSDRIGALAVPIKLLVYSERPALAELSIRPQTESPAVRRRADSLRVSAQGRVVMTLPLATEASLTATLPLQRDFTLIALSVEDEGMQRAPLPSIPIATLSLRTLGER
jgi:uncharacterized protein YjeT (DUF2065 family)